MSTRMTSPEIMKAIFLERRPGFKVAAVGVYAAIFYFGYSEGYEVKLRSLAHRKWIEESEAALAARVAARRSDPDN